MSTFDDIVAKTKDIASKVGKKTNDFIDVTKLKVNASDVEKDICSIYEGIGRLVYDSKKNGTNVDELVDECILKLDERLVHLDGLRLEIDNYKNILRCEECGTGNTDDTVFCKRCGKKIR